MRAKRPKRLPTALSREEVSRLFEAIPSDSTYRRMLELMYGSGLRVSECCKLRVCDADFDRGQLIVRDPKGKHDRVTVLSKTLSHRLKQHVEKVRKPHGRDVGRGHGFAPVPTSLEHKRHSASREIRWQLLFGSTMLRYDQTTNRHLRWHTSPSTLNHVVKEAADMARIDKRVTCHSLRHSFAHTF